MRFRTLEIRWHDSKPISTCDFQPLSFKKARPAAGQESNYTTQSYRLATGGEDNHVRVWMVHPHLRPPTVIGDADPSAGGSAAPRPPRVEYLATLSRHSAAVNVVRFSPNGELIASAGDDGMIIIWAPSTSPQAATYGSDLNAEDLQHEKEYWKPRTTFRCTTMQVYDLAWSPTGEYIIAGSTDNTARVFASADGKCVHEIAEHSHYVQGVAWDPLNEYIATQSSDRSMHIYSISTKPGGVFEAHAVGKNTRMPHHQRRSRVRSHSRTPSVQGGGGGGGRPRLYRRESITSASGAEDSSVFALDLTEDSNSVSGTGNGNGNGKDSVPLTPATSSASLGGGNSTPSFMFPPPPIEASASSRRSSFSSNAPGSPSPFVHNNHGGGGSRYGRSPSPMPPLPAIRSVQSPAAATNTALWTNVKLYGDESYTNFFRRLSFSPDGGLLLTPAGQFEDPSVLPGATKHDEATPTRGRKGHPSESSANTSTGSSGATSSVYIYSRANFARPPIAQLPGHKKASVAVRFSPVLYELRPGVTLPAGETKKEKDVGTPSATLEKGVNGDIPVDINGPLSASDQPQASMASATPSSAPLRSGVSSLATPQRTPGQSTVATPAPRPALSTTDVGHTVDISPMLSPVDLRPPTPAASKPASPGLLLHTPSNSQSQSQLQHGHTPSQSHSNQGSVAPPQTSSVFALPYRLLFAVLTMDTVAIYDTQQATPLCLLTKLHYDEFTDLTWSSDGQCLILSSRDGYCTLIAFDEILPAYHTQQHTLQLQSIAHHNSVPLTYAHGHSSSTQVTPAATPSIASVNLPHITPSASSSSTSMNPKKRSEPPLTPVGSDKGDYFAPPLGQVLEHPAASSSSSEQVAQASDAADTAQQPPKKKRRVALTRVGDLEPGA